MRYQQDLQVQLRTRYRRLMVIGHTTFAHEVGLIHRWMLAQPALRVILDDLATAEPEHTVERWEELCEASRRLRWPTTTEAGRARLVWAWMSGLGDTTDAPRGLAMNVGGGGNLNDRVHTLTQSVLDVLFTWLEERLSAESSVLYLLERYVRRVEWFDREDLYQRYQGDTRRGEAIYDQDLRRWLFDQGMSMPFSQARSASGLSDVVGDIDGDDPLLCEVKLFDAGDHDKRGVVVGAHQVVQYAQDHGMSAGYLVIINLSGRVLELPSDGEDKAWPPHIGIAGVRVHLIAVRALHPLSASKLGKARPIVLTRQDFTDPDTPARTTA